MTAPKGWTRDEVRRRLSNIGVAVAERGPSDRTRHAYQDAAAVLHGFDPAALRPAGWSEDHAETEADVLLGDVLTGRGRKGALRWILRPEIRRRSLGRLVENNSLGEILDHNETGPGDLVGRLLQTYLRGRRPELGDQSSAELAATLKILRWLGGLSLPDLPERSRVERQLTVRRLVETFDYLAGEHFYGRENELTDLREYVGVQPPGSTGRAFWRGVRDVFGWHEKPPLMIHGPGGSGKSTLLSHFVLEHFKGDEASRFPFVYVDFDRSDISVEDLFGLVGEAVRQLRAQLPKADNEWSELAADLQDHGDSAQQVHHDAEDVRSFESTAAVGLPFGLRATLDQLQSIFLSAAGGERPLVFILDTFEEVQYESRPQLLRFWEFLQELQRRLPRLRVILSGRAPEPDIKIKPLPLDDLEAPAAEKLLALYGIDDPAVRRALVRQLGGNPLTLRLAKEVVIREGADDKGIRRFKTRSGLSRLQQDVIQGMLYDRILEHIHDDDVRQLAHPGLVLRLVTPELILHVLAEACGLQIGSLAEAEALYDDLARENALVAFADEGGLRVRSDLRRAALPLIRADRPDQVEDIHRRAVRHFEQLEDPRHRAEEIYHRLCLGEMGAAVDGLWIEGLRPHLVPSLEELPARGQTYLASRFSDVDLPREVWHKADQEDWERSVLAEGRDWLKQGRTAEALKLIKERPRKKWLPESQLPALEAEILIARKKWPQARKLLEEELEPLIGSGRRRYRFELLLMFGHVYMAEDKYEAAAARLRAAVEIAAELDAKDLLLRGLVALLEVLEKSGRRDSAGFREAASQAKEVFAGLEDSELRELPSLTRQLGSILGRDDHQILARVIPLALPSYGGADRVRLQHTLEELAHVTEKLEIRQKGVFKVETLGRVVDKSSSRRINQTLSKFLRNSDDLESAASFKVLLSNIAEKLGKT